jgi:hypothetical protein
LECFRATNEYTKPVARRTRLKRDENFQAK